MTYQLDLALGDAEGLPGILDRSFWEYVDTAPNWDWRPHADGWAEERVSDQCMAMAGRGTRCSGWVLGVPRAPFCSRHIDKAVEWFLALAGEPTLRQYREALAGLREARDAHLAATAALADTAADGRVAKVYFYYLPESSLVKIGTSLNVELRVAAFSKGQGCAWPEGVSPKGGRLLGTMPGGRPLEGALHRRFYAHRIRGTEWFHYGPLSKAINELLAVEGVAS